MKPFEALGAQLAEARSAHAMRPQLHRRYSCRCGAAVFFRNDRCLSCDAELGYVPAESAILPLEADPATGALRIEGGEGRFRRCANHEAPAACNWVIEANDPNPFCVACRLNRTIPDLDDPENARCWAAIELAKRRLVAQLLGLGLPVRSRVDEDAEAGLMFDFLRSPAEGPRVLTGHASGLITINIEEADDSVRARIRQDLREPYRTLLGHFRHEVGHYYWDLLVWGGKWLEPVREVFGDERESYAEALRRNYEDGPRPDWADAHISAYASVHPWEDWAETWAHYLHINDGLATALGFGLESADLEVDVAHYGPEDLYAPDDPDAARCLALLNGWIETITVLNEVARSMGQPDFYPFVLSRSVVRKLQLVHMIVADARDRAAASTSEAA